MSGLVRELGRKIFPDHWSFMLGEVALYSFIVILLSGTFLTFFFQASMAEVVYDGSYAPLKGLEMSAAMRVDARHQLRHPRRPADAPDPPLGGAAVRGVDRPAHAARVLHRRVPQAARAQLADRLRAVHPRDGRGLHRLLAPRRPALGQRPPHHRRHGQGHADHRHLDLEPAVRRRVPRHPGRRHVLQPAHPAAAGDPASRRSACTWCCWWSTSTPSSPAPAAPTTTSSACRSCRCSPPRPVASSSSSSA